jgi:hypothetical protein
MNRIALEIMPVFEFFEFMSCDRSMSPATKAWKKAGGMRDVVEPGVEEAEVVGGRTEVAVAAALARLRSVVFGRRVPDRS